MPSQDFFRYMNPLMLQAALSGLDDEEKNKKLVFQEDPKKDVTKIGNMELPNVRPVFPNSTMMTPQNAGPNRNTYNGNPITDSPANILKSFVDPATENTINTMSASVGNQTRELANTIENSDPTAPELRPLRDTLRSQVESNMTMPTEASYNPDEHGWKGQLRHMGESFLLGLANTPRDAHGMVDPLTAGVAASSTALFGGRGVHGQIARQFLQPRLDDIVKRSRDKVASNTSEFSQLSKLYPDTTANKVEAAKLRIAADKDLLGDAELDKKSQVGLGLSDRAFQKNVEEKKREEESTYKRITDAATINHALSGNSAIAAQGKARVGFSQDIHDAIQAVNKDVAVASGNYKSAVYLTRQWENRINNSDMLPAEKAQAEKELIKAKSDMQASEQKAVDAATIYTDNLNARLGRKIAQVNIERNPDGTLSKISVGAIKGANEEIKSYFDANVPTATTNDDPMAAEIYRRFYNRK